jgi:hypothetical protein
VCKAQDVHARVLIARDREFEKDRDLPPTSPRPGDGQHTYLRRATPDEIEKHQQRAKDRRGR